MIQMKKQLFILTFISITLLLKGQTVQPLNVHIPTSPQAEAFQKFGDIAINYSTGTPNISIPLFEINHRGYKLPLNLRYNPQPLKPGYNYDVFGQGWGLSINSCVSRSIEYLPDETRDFKLETDKLNLVYCASCDQSGDAANQLRLDFSGYNFAHDKFNVVLPNGSSFDFIMEKDYGNNLVYKVSDGRSVKINCIWSPGNIEKFIVTDEDGVQYTFNQGDKPHILSGDLNSSYYVSWQLTRIDLPNSSEPITIAYTNTISSPIVACTEPGLNMSGDMHGVLVNGMLLLARGYNLSIPSSGPSYGYTMKLPTSISYGAMNIEFQYGTTPREGASHLYMKELIVREGGSLVRDIKMGMSMKSSFAGGCAGPYDLVKLDGVCIWGSSSLVKPQIYKCSYQSSDFSFSGTDHWGYLNYSNSNCIANFNVYTEFENDAFNGYMTSFQNLLTPIARTIPQNQFPYNEFKLSKGGNRTPAGPQAHGVLSRIIYPTGGYTDLEFENHQILTSTDANGEYISNSHNRMPAQAGGFRIKKITNYNSDNTVATTMNYRYGRVSGSVPVVNQISNHTGLGEPVVDPNILTYMNHSARSSGGGMRSDIARYMVLGINERGDRIGIVNPFIDFMGNAFLWECNFSASNFRRILNGRQPVIYPEVTVYYGDTENQRGCAGKTVYKYDIWGDMGSVKDLLSGSYKDSLFFESPSYYGNTIDYEKKGYEYNKLVEKNDYKFENNSFTLVLSEKSKWNKQSIMFLDYVHTNPYPYSMPAKYDLLSNYLTTKMNFIGDSKLSSKETISYTSDGSITATDSIFYNDRRQPYLKINVNSSGTIIKNSFVYPYVYYNGSSPAIISKLVDKNIISPVIESKIEVTNSNGVSTTAGAKVDYAEFNNGITIAPTAAYQLELKTSGNEYALQNQINYYTANGNPIEILSKDGIYTTYLWGYQDKYVIAEIKNATYGAVKAALGYTDSQMSTLFASTSPDMSLINTLRTALPNTYITTYTYGNQGVISSTTDPRGVSTYYEYDAFYRLSLARNDDNNIIGRNLYAYQDASNNASLTATVTPGAGSYTSGATGTATLGSVTGGLGSYTYSWYLKNSAGSVLASNLNTTSTSFSYTCSQTGVLTIQCVITDNLTGGSATVSSNITVTSVTYSCNFTMQPGYSNMTNSISCDNSTTTFYLTFSSSSTMQLYTSYVVANICSNCRPSTQRGQTFTSGGRTWSVVVDTNGDVRFILVNGSAFPAGSYLGTGTLTFSK